MQRRVKEHHTLSILLFILRVVTEKQTVNILPENCRALRVWEDFLPVPVIALWESYWGIDWLIDLMLELIVVLLVE